MFSWMAIVCLSYLLTVATAVQSLPPELVAKEHELTRLLQEPRPKLGDLGAAERALTRFLQGQPTHSPELQAKEQELTNLLQAKLQTYDQGEHSVEYGGMDFIMGRESSTTTPQNLNVAADPIPMSWWKEAEDTIRQAGLSTPIPKAAFINAQPPPPTPQPWEKVLREPQQPLATRIGGRIMYGLTGSVTPTPPPSQDETSQSFVRECPLLLFGTQLSIRAPSCGAKLGFWQDPNPLNEHAVARWRPTNSEGLVISVDSAITGPGSALFADISPQVTLKGYKFKIKNCKGVERWHLEEKLVKFDNMGKVKSSMELHDVALNTVQYYVQYVIRSPTGSIAASTDLVLIDQNEVNFTKWENGRNTHEILAMAKRQGQWTKKGWEECMDPTSPRGWTLDFTGKPAMTTVQDIRVAIAGSMTLLAYRDQYRAKSGVNERADEYQTFIVVVIATLIVLMSILLCNFYMVFRSSGIQRKLRAISFDLQNMILPKKPMNQRTPLLHPSY